MLTVFSSCEHKDLCFDHDAHAPKSDVHIKAVYEKEWEHTCEGGPDWEQYPAWESRFGMDYHELCPDAPDGLRIQVYNEDGTNNVLNVAPEGDIVRMRPGEHSLLLYNNDTEYIVFDDMNSFASAKATTRTRTRASYGGNPYMENTVENTVNAPDMLYGKLQGRAQDGDRRTARDHAPVGFYLSGALRVQSRAGIRGAGTRSLGGYGGCGMAEQRTHLRRGSYHII